MKYQIKWINKGRCPRCTQVENLLGIKFMGRYYSTGKIIPASPKTKVKEIWECQMGYMYKRIRTRFKYRFGVRVCT